MGDIINEIQSRRARRALDTRRVPPEVIDRVLTAATLAPSCSNKQPWRFVVASEPAFLEKVKACLSGGNYWAKNAPVIILVMTREDLDAQLSDDRHYAQFDTGMSAMSLMLQATAEGLYAHPIAGFDPIALKESLGIAADWRLITLINVGYPGSEDHLSDRHKEQEHSSRSRKDPGEVIHHNLIF